MTFRSEAETRDAIVERIALLSGRPEIRVPEEARDRIGRRRILVTGGGGSVASALIQEMAAGNRSVTVYALDQDDSSLQRITRQCSGIRVEPILATVRDLSAIQSAFGRIRPEVVIHTAALKHTDLLEEFPREALLTNVLGTLNVLQAADDHDCAIVNLSTDKAANPCSILGYSKRIGEGLVAWFGRVRHQRATSVRLGNVLGTRGSAIETFINQATCGAPITITDARMTRYFMKPQEVAALLRFAIDHPERGTCVVPDLGFPVSMMDVAGIILDVVGVNSGLNFVGIRPGERLHECMLDELDDVTSMSIPIAHHEVKVPLVTPEAASELSDLRSSEAIREGLKSLCKPVNR